MSRFRVLIIDDDADLLALTGDVLVEHGYEVSRAAAAETGLEMVRAKHFDGILLDLRLADSNGLDILQQLKSISPLTEVIMVTGYASVETAVEAMRHGAFQYLSKPVNMPELLLITERATRTARDAHERELLAERLRRREERHDTMIVASACMQEILQEAEDMAELDKPVFIHGETGTGKGVLASYIHSNSQRAEGPFNILNCGTLTENLVDAELFGYEKGAFTGADKSRPGIIAASHQGTLFLDEIGDIPEPAQVRLLRFLENGVVRPLGSTRERAYDVRIIAATHKDLAVERNEGRFREDLYHRLVVFDIHLPALRDRQADIEPMAKHFLQALSPREAYSLAPNATTVLEQQGWTGNIRELRNEIERAWLRARRRGSHEITAQDLRLGDNAANDTGAHGGYGPISLAEAELRHVLQVLAHTGNNKRQAAKVLGISERHIYRLLAEAEKLDLSG